MPRPRRGRELSEAEVLEMLELLWAGEETGEVARAYGTSRSNAAKISSGAAWVGVPRPPGARALRGRGLRPEQAARGEANGRAVLTEALAAEVVARLAEGATAGEVAGLHGVSRSAVDDIASGRSWRHLPRPWGPGPLRARGARGRKTERGQVG